MFSEIRKKLDEIINLGIPGNELTIYKDRKCIFREARGYSDEARTVKMKGDELVNLYSASKLITCTSAMKLYESGAFSLDDPLYEYLPEFREMSVRVGNDVVKAKKHIRIRDLFTMGAGFDYAMSAPELIRAKEATDGKCPTRRVMEYYAARPLCFEPGESWKYSFCHDVLAALVEEVSGVRFGEYVKRNVFDVAGMKRSTYSLPDDRLGEIMVQYSYNPETKKYSLAGPKIQSYKLGDEYESGGAGCISCTDDYINFLEALRVGKIIKPETLALMTKNQLTEKQYRAFAADQPKLSGYTFGLGCWCDMGNPDRDDFGWTGAAGSVHYINERLGFSVFYLQHVIAGPNREIWPDVRRAVYKAINNL